MEKQKRSNQFHKNESVSFNNQIFHQKSQASQNFDINDQIGTIPHINDEDSELQLKGLIGLKSPGSQMRKNSQIRNIRSDIQNLDGYESFAISSFAESKNGFNNPIQTYAKFPTVNAPSLQLGQQDEDYDDSFQQDKGNYQAKNMKYINQRTVKNPNSENADLNDIKYFNSFNPNENIKKTEKNKKIILNPKNVKKSVADIQTYLEDITQRNQSLPSIIKLEKQIEQLNKLSKSKDNTIERMGKTAESLSKKCSQYEETIRKYEKSIIEKDRMIQKTIQDNQRLEKIVKEIQGKSNKKILLSQKSSVSSIGNLLKNQKEFSQSFQNNSFCFQMLSPDESLSLLEVLLKKVSKSSYMKKMVLKDPRMIEILSKLKG